MKLYAIHTIERGPDAKPSRVEPNTIFDASEKEIETLLAMRAAREATAEEIALADAHAAQRAAPTQVDDTKPPTPSDRELLEAKATELGVKFSANIGDEKLAERINEAEAAKKPDDSLV